MEFPGIATLVEPESLASLVEGIERALDCVSPNEVAREYAREYLDKETILRRFEGDLVSLVQQGG